MNFTILKRRIMEVLRNKYFLGLIVILVIASLITVLFFKNNFFMSLASATKNPLFCDNISDSVYRDTCYFTFALHNEDSSVCGKMDKDLVKNLCNAIAKRDSSLCTLVETAEAKDACYLNINRFKPDISNCPRIENEIDRDNCFSFVAEAKNDVVVCENIKNENVRDQCKKNF